MSCVCENKWILETARNSAESKTTPYVAGWPRIKSFSLQSFICIDSGGSSHSLLEYTFDECGKCFWFYFCAQFWPIMPPIHLMLVDV